MNQPKKPYLIDTNVLLRYLIGDTPQQAAQASALMESAEEGSQELEIPPTIVAEVVWTLEKFYQVPRGLIAEKLLMLFSLKGVKGPEKKIILAALQSYTSLKIDFVDCYLAARAVDQGMRIYSFDKKDFNRLRAPWEIP